MHKDTDVQHFRPFTQGQVVDYYALWILIHSVMTKEYPVHEGHTLAKVADERLQSTHVHPVLLAEGAIPFDREQLYHVMVRNTADVKCLLILVVCTFGSTITMYC